LHARHIYHHHNMHVWSEDIEGFSKLPLLTQSYIETHFGIHALKKGLLLAKHLVFCLNHDVRDVTQPAVKGKVESKYNAKTFYQVVIEFKDDVPFSCTCECKQRCVIN
jgi:hypothetical protein